MSEQAPLGNKQIAAFFEKIADLMQLQQQNPFKTRAYRRAAETIRALPRDINQDYRAGTLREIPGIGDAIAEKIAEIIESGRLGFLERLEATVPAGVAELMKIPDIGPKSAMAIYETLAVDSIDALERAARAGELRKVSGIGPKSEQRILAGIEAYSRRSERLLMGHVLPRAEVLLDAFRALAGERLLRTELAGSLRRRQAMVGNIDLLAAAEPDRHAELVDLFQQLPQVGETVATAGQTGTVRLHSGEQVDLRVVAPDEWGIALQYFTGSPDHNRRLRQRAEAAGLTFEGYRLRDGSGEPYGFEQERELYERLDLPWIPPELREDQGEFEAARDALLPDLIDPADLRGDLHMHSTWSDGRERIVAMAQAARERGYEYIVITDHSQSLAMTGGLSPERLIQQRYEIINVNAQFEDFAVLQGAEVEIKADGSLDYPDELLAQLDVVIASMHSGIRAGRDTVTRRMLAAIRNPHVDVIGHMTNRLLGRREGADLDMDLVLRTAAEQGTILEINAQPDRLDLDPVHARQALEYGCLLAVSSDAHSPAGLDTIRHGISQARRAWAEPDDVINSRGLEEFLSYIQQRPLA